jgi:hypothetical protein
MRDNRGWRASAKAGAEPAREQRGSSARKQGRKWRASRVGRACALIFPACALLFYHARSLFLSRSRSRALTRILLARSFFPAPGRLNRHEATLRDASPAKATHIDQNHGATDAQLRCLPRCLSVTLATPQGHLKIYEYNTDTTHPFTTRDIPLKHTSEL